MKIYVAGSTVDIRRVRQCQILCAAHGHRITHDWTANVEEVGGPALESALPHETCKRFALNDYFGVQNANTVIAFVDLPNLGGTLMEIGMALAWRIPVWTLGTPFRNIVFYAMDELITSFSGLGDSKFHEALAREQLMIRMQSPPTITPPSLD